MSRTIINTLAAPNAPAAYSQAVKAAGLILLPQESHLSIQIRARSSRARWRPKSPNGCVTSLPFSKQVTGKLLPLSGFAPQALEVQRPYVMPEQNFRFHSAPE